MSTPAPQIIPNLWFDTQAEEAAAFYVETFPDSEVLEVHRYPEGSPGEPGTVMQVLFSLNGMRFVAINGGPQFPHSEAVSFEVPCADQAEVDHYWAVLSDCGKEGQCGWLSDRFGVCWQVVPQGMGEVLGDDDPERASRAMQAMLGMNKLDIGALRRAAGGEPVA